MSKVRVLAFMEGNDYRKLKAKAEKLGKSHSELAKELILNGLNKREVEL